MLATIIDAVDIAVDKIYQKKKNLAFMWLTY